MFLQFVVVKWQFVFGAVFPGEHLPAKCVSSWTLAAGCISAITYSVDVSELITIDCNIYDNVRNLVRPTKDVGETTKRIVYRRSNRYHGMYCIKMYIKHVRF